MPRFLAELADPFLGVREVLLEGEDQAHAVARLPLEDRDRLRRVRAGGDGPGGLGGADLTDDGAHLAGGDGAALDGAPGARAVWRLAWLLERGVPLAPALRSVAGSVRQRRLREHLWGAAASAEEGGLPPEVLRLLGTGVSAPEVRDLLEAGRRRGELPAALGELALVAARLARTRRQVLSALSYPLLLASLQVVFAAVIVAVNGPSARLALASARARGAEPAWSLRVLSAAPSSELALGAVALGALVVLVLTRRLCASWLAGGALTSRRGGRDALVLQTLGALVRREVPAPRAWALTGRLLGAPAGGAAPGEVALRGADPGVGLDDGGRLEDALESAGVVGPGERAALNAVAAAGPQAFGAELLALGEARLRTHEERARVGARRLGLATQLLVAGTVLAVGIACVAGAAWT